VSGQLTIILAAHQPDPCTAPLCGRPAVDWLLDTVAAVRPDSVCFMGCGAAAVLERAEGVPALRRVLSTSGGSGGSSPRASTGGPPPVGTGPTVVLSCLNPLLRPTTIRQALRTLVGNAEWTPAGERLPPGQAGFRAVLIRSQPAARWWSDGPRALTTAAVAYAGQAGDCPQWLARLEPADARTLKGRLRGIGAEVVVTDAGLVESLRGDDPVDRQLAQAALYQKIAAGWQRRGVLIDDPATTRIDGYVRIGRGTRIRPHTELIGSTVVGAGASIGPVTTLRDTTAGDECVIRYSVCEEVSIGDHAHIGPFSWLRSGARLGARTRAGSFVEVADSVIGDDTQIPHVAGLLGATVGEGCNIAGLTGTAIFDGQVKHRVTIGDHAFIGAANVLVGPLSIGDGAYTAACSLITRDVPAGALAIARTRQLAIEGWVASKMPGSAAAQAAARTAAKHEKSSEAG
jgi:bifunctional UDP-N-acetylglucosamine pyrophosphorylase/glucosamine-1-phosphate N-acetyltransferase